MKLASKNIICVALLAAFASANPAFAAGGTGGGGGGGGGGVVTPPVVIAPVPGVTVAKEAGIPAGIVGGFGAVASGNTFAHLEFDSITAALGISVYNRIGAIWNKQATLRPTNPVPTSLGGGQVDIALDGDTLVLGVSNNTFQTSALFNPNPVLLPVQVYRRTQGVWLEEAKLVGSDAALAAVNFGASVAVSGDTIVVGAPGGFAQVPCGVPVGVSLCPSNVYRGVVYVFQRIGTTWTETAKVTAGPAGIVDNFGSVLALSGDTFVAGHDAARGIPTKFNQAEVFQRPAGTNQWNQQAVLKATDLVAGNLTYAGGFGSLVAINGNMVLVGGTVEADLAHKTTFGAAYVFQRSSGVWSKQAKLTPAQRLNWDDFGALNVSISGDLVAIGVNTTVSPKNFVGAVSVFRRVGKAWGETSIASPGLLNVPAVGTVVLHNELRGDSFARSLSISGDTLIVDQPMVYTPMTYVYRLTPQ